MKKTTDKKKQCWLCGKSKKLLKTECCGMWICDDEANYEMFSCSKNSCSRNHRRYTLCAFHYNEWHSWDWQDCKVCKDDFDTETYVYYGTNEYNFEKLKNVPKFKPVNCFECWSIINLWEDGHMKDENWYTCLSCYYN